MGYAKIIPQGPYSAKALEYYGCRVIDSKGNWVAKADTLVFARRIARALNAAEARSSQRWEVAVDVNGWDLIAKFDGAQVSIYDVVATLNAHGVCPMKTDPAKKGARR